MMFLSNSIKVMTFTSFKCLKLNLHNNLIGKEGMLFLSNGLKTMTLLTNLNL